MDWLHKQKIRTRKKLKKLFPPDFFWRQTSLLLLLFFLLIAAGEFLLKEWFDSNSNSPSPGLKPDNDKIFSPSIQIQKNTEQLKNVSFSDNFSGDGWLDSSRTTLFHDQSITALTFPPVFLWKETEEKQNDVPNPLIQGNEISFCIDDRCLIQNGRTLFFSESGNKLELTLPFNPDSAESISIGKLSSVWVLGVVEKSAGKHKGKVFVFDGKDFKEFSNNKKVFFIESNYVGTMGFGGTDGNWLMVYGGYEGKLIHIKENKIADDSRLLGIRPMNGGFYPSVIYLPKNGIDNWYLFSLSSGNPKLIKLWSSEDGNLAGAINLTEELGLFEFQRAVFWEEKGLVSAQAETESKKRKFLFVDNGFASNRPLEAVSKNLNQRPVEVYTVKISVKDAPQTPFQILVSNNGEEWQQIKPGVEFNFPDQKGKMLFWKAIFSPGANRFLAPFFTSIEILYKIKNS